MNYPDGFGAVNSRAPCCTGGAPLAYQLCKHCGRSQLPLGGICLRCGSRHLAPQVSAGRGTIYSHTTIYRAPSAAFADAVPYTLILVDLDEGYRLMTNLERVGRHCPVIGDRVQIHVKIHPGGRSLTQAFLIACDSR